MILYTFASLRLTPNGFASLKQELSKVQGIRPLSHAPRTTSCFTCAKLLNFLN